MLAMLTLTQVFLAHLVGVFFKNKAIATQNTLAMLNLLSSWKWVSCGESWKSLFPIFLIFHRTDFDGFLVCCWIAIQQLNGVEKNYVAISLMLNHNLTGLIQRKHLV